jgi:hypothetical protein
MSHSQPKRPSPIQAGLAALLCLAVASARAEAAEAQVYECNQGGTVTFSETPCAGQERKVDIEYDRLSPTQSQDAQAAEQSAEDRAGAVAQADLLDTEILNVQQEIGRLQTERDARLAAMKQQRDIGGESLDQAAWLAQQNAQIASVYQDYSDRIVTATAKLSDLQAQRAALGGPAPGPGSQ